MSRSSAGGRSQYYRTPTTTATSTGNFPITNSHNGRVTPIPDGIRSSFREMDIQQQHNYHHQIPTTTATATTISSSSGQQGGGLSLWEDGDNKSHQMCGVGMIDRLLGKQLLPINGTTTTGISRVGGNSSSNILRYPVHHSLTTATTNSSTTNTINNKNCLNPSIKLLHARTSRYEQVTEALLSPEDTESTSSSSDKSKSDEVVWPDKGDADVDNTHPPEIVQFDPFDLKLIMCDQQLEVLSGTCKTRNSGKATGGNTTMSAKKTNVRPNPFRTNQPAWSLTLPAVTEERSQEGDSFDLPSPQENSKNHPILKPKSGKSNRGGSSIDQHRKEPESKANISPEKKQVLIAMRDLVIKQQSALQELSGENDTFRRELSKCLEAISQLKQQTAAQTMHIEQLITEKDMIDAEAAWLREEVQALSGLAIPTTLPTSSSHQVNTTRTIAPIPIQQVPDNSSTISLNLSEVEAFEQFKKALMTDSRLRSVLHGLDTQMQEDKPKSAMNRNGGTVSVLKTGVDDRGPAQINVGGVPKKVELPEEVALFKHRLETLQKKRLHRRSVSQIPTQQNGGGTGASRPVVRFRDESHK